MIEGKLRADEDRRTAFTEFLREQDLIADDESVMPTYTTRYEGKKGLAMSINLRITTDD